MNKANIQLEYRDRVAIVTLNRPAKKNAFDEAMFSALENISDRLKQARPRAIILTGEGSESFSAGFDVNPENPLVGNILQVMESGETGPAVQLVNRIRRAVDGFVSLPVPVIAAINGLAYGGGAELAMRCDMRVMDKTAVICFSEVRLGLIPDWGGGATLTRLVGASVASDLVLTARKVPAAEALQLGLVNRITEAGNALEEAAKIGEQISNNGPKAVQHALRVIRKSRDLNLEDSLALEAETAAELIASGECLVGIAAFLEKKKPEFPPA